MTTPQRPEEFPPQAGGELPDLSLRDFGPSLEDALDSNASGDKPDQQSIFSRRSGIQDPLVRPEVLRPEGRVDENGEPGAESAAEVATHANETAEPGGPEQELPEGPAIERKGRGTKARPRLVKSKRHLDRARRRQKNYLQERRDKKRLRVFFYRVRLIFKLCFVVLWCVLLWQVAHSPLWVLDQPRFSVSDAHLIQPAQLSPWVKQQVGKPIYAIDTGKLARKIKKSFDIANVVVVRRQMFPTRLDILVQERQPWAEIYATDPNPRVSMREAGEAQEVEKPAAKQPVIRPYGVIASTGIISLAPYHYQPGVFGPKPLNKLIVTPKTVFSLHYLERLHELIWQAGQIKGLHLQSVDVRNPKRIVFNYQELPVVLGPLNATATQRLARLALLIPKINEYRDVMQSVDLQWEEHPTFHQKPNAKLDLPKQEPTQG